MAKVSERDMRRRNGLRHLALLAGVLLSASGMWAQEPTTIRTSVREVVVDVVVHDKHGKLARKVQPGEVTLLDDGVRQEITSMRLVSGGEEPRLQNASSVAAVTARASGGFSPLRTVNMVSMVFQDLTPDTRKPALDAALEFLRNEQRPNTWIGVFTLDDAGVHPMVAYTNNQAALTEAIRRAASGQLRTLSASAQQIFTAVGLERELSFNPPPPPVQAGSAPPPPSTGGLGFGPNTGAFVDASTATGDEASDAVNNPLARQGIHYQRVVAVRELHSLGWLISQLAFMPFHKTVIMFSPGIDRPASERDYWQKMITEANRANISFYIADLRASSGGATVATASQSRASGLSQSQNKPPQSGKDLMDRSQEFDVSEHATAEANLHLAQVDLAESTGGFVLTDFGQRMLKRVMDDVETHYELTFRPTSPGYDGRYHRINVKLDQGDLRVEARPGYFAVPAESDDGLGAPVLAGLRALNTTPLPRAFDYRTEALRFLRNDGRLEAAVVFDLPKSSLAATPVPDRKHRIHPSFLALIKDSSGQVVGQFSADAPEMVSDAGLSASGAGRLQFSRHLTLEPGRYTLETAIVDWESGRTSAAVSQYDWSKREAPGLSAIVLVRRSENVTGVADPADPLVHEGKRILPSLFAQLEPGAQSSIFFRVYPDAGNAVRPRLRAQFFLDGRLLADQTADLPAPDASGSIPVLIQAPGRPGSNEMKLTVLQGRASSSGQIQYTIAK